jgi:hypothetical protein
MMKPIAPSQSKSPASVPRLAAMSGSILLYIISLWRMYATTNDGAPVRFLRADHVQRALLSRSPSVLWLGCPRHPSRLGLLLSDSLKTKHRARLSRNPRKLFPNCELPHTSQPIPELCCLARPAWCPTVETRARARSDCQEGITPCSALKANRPHPGLHRLCYKNGAFVSSGRYGDALGALVPLPQWQES